MWEITDDNGTIYSGSESEMREQYALMTHELDNGYEEEPECGWCEDEECEYCEGQSEPEDYDWDGDLRLIQVHNIYR